MADPLTVVGTITGLASLMLPIANGINSLRDICKSAKAAPAELNHLLGELEFMVLLMQEASSEIPGGDYVFQRCQQSCERVNKGLQALVQVIDGQSQNTGKPKPPKVWAFRHWKKDAGALKQDIHEAKSDLMLLHIRRISTQVSLGNRLPRSHDLASICAASPTSDQVVSAASSGPSEQSPIIAEDSNFVRHPRFRNRGNCLSMACPCRCHCTVRTAGRFWSFEYTPLGLSSQTCDKSTCNTTRSGGGFQISLSKLGFQVLLNLQLHILTKSESGTRSLRPSLQLESTVPYTSTGFEIIWRCRHGMMTFQEAQKMFLDLYRTNKHFPDHINPGGKSYIEELLRSPWDPGVRSAQFQLLELFVVNFGMTRGTAHPRFLTKCAEWIGEGPHLSLLEELLYLGFDPAEVDAQDWPQPCSPNWISEEWTPDPFFIEYITLLCKDNQGFGGMTPLHEAIMFGSPESVKRWIDRSDKDTGNFLGQTPLHFAVYKPQYLDDLIKSGHDLDAVDNYGITPLMYAAATNHQESATILVNAGADPTIKDSRYQRTFMHYAAARRNWKLVLNFLCQIEHIDGECPAKGWSQIATYLFHVEYPDYLGTCGVSLHQFLVKCGGSVNFTFYDWRHETQNNSLMHSARSVSDLKALLQNGFDLVNHSNSAGRHPLMAAADRCEPALVSALLDAGSEVNRKDTEHHTSLSLALKRLDQGNYWSVMDTVKILLANDASVLARDECRCPCSPNGCLTAVPPSCSGFFQRTNAYFSIWEFEWLNLLLEHDGVDVAKEVLISFIRKAKHAELGMTHVCCQSNDDSLIWEVTKISDDDIDDIVDEESEFVDILDSEISDSCKRQYDVLLQERISLMKMSLQKRCEEVEERNKREEEDEFERQSQSGFQIDRKNDCFTRRIFVPCTEDPMYGVQRSIAKYILWLEEEFLRGSTSYLQEHTKQNWYLKRRRVLRLVTSMLEIPDVKLAQKVKSVSTSGSDRPVDIVECIRHFLDSGIE